MHFNLGGGGVSPPPFAVDIRCYFLIHGLLEVHLNVCFNCMQLGLLLCMVCTTVKGRALLR